MEKPIMEMDEILQELRADNVNVLVQHLVAISATTAHSLKASHQPTTG